MSEANVQAVAEVASHLSRVRPSNLEEAGIYGLLVGALYALRRAFELGYVDRTGDYLPPDYNDELVRVVRGLASSSDVSEILWLAGFYFNASLWRLAPVRERLGKYARAGTDLISSVHDEVNRLKHDTEGLLDGRNVSSADALRAARMLTTSVEIVFKKSET